MAIVNVIVPDTTGQDSAKVSFVYKQAGDRVARDEAVVELLTDKAAMDIPSPVDGRIVRLHVTEADTVHPDQPLFDVEECAG